VPADEVLGEVAAFIGRNAVGLVSELVFSKYGARYFHGIGRRIIALGTLGRVRIQSSLRQVPKGERPKPGINDWLALFTGVAVWLGSAGATIFYVMA
jgi:hypothetical protein